VACHGHADVLRRAAFSIQVLSTSSPSVQPVFSEHCSVFVGLAREYGTEVARMWMAASGSVLKVEREVMGNFEFVQENP